MDNVLKLKRRQLQEVARHRDKLRVTPHLRWLFFEITDRCNLFCRHCGSRCTSDGQFLTVEDVRSTLSSIRGDKPMICLTGGEPLLHPDFYEIAECVHSMGFSWGMTTNAMLIDETVAHRLKQTGMSTVSISFMQSIRYVGTGIVWDVAFLAYFSHTHFLQCFDKFFACVFFI